MFDDVNRRLTPDGDLEQSFRRQVRDVLDLDVFTRDDAILAELRRLKALETREYKASK